VYEIFFPMVAFGAGEHITLAGGMSMIPGATGQLVYLAPKFTPISRENLSVSAGLLYISSTFGNGGVGVIYGVATVGGQKAAASFGLGWGFDDDQTSDRPVALAGLELRLSNSVKFISENWIPPAGKPGDLDVRRPVLRRLSGG